MKERSIATVVLTVGALGCGYAIRTSTDYDRAVNFSNYRTFSILQGASSGNTVQDQRATADVKDALVSRGWLEVPTGENQAAVVVHAATKTKHTYQTFYDGWGGWNWRWGSGLGGATTYVEDYKVGTLVVDIFDANTKQAIWRGYASDALPSSPSGKAKATREALDKMFAQFPPSTTATQ